MRYLLDTNIISNIMKFPEGVAASRMAELEQEEINTSIIVAAELRFGYTKVASKRLETLAEEMLSDIEVLPWDSPADRGYASLRTQLEEQGTPIGQNDMLIAAHALSTDAVLVTDNDKEFSRVAGLKVENWLR
jgi:tRNA(fMet)-specific endonuclease VapC